MLIVYYIKRVLQLYNENKKVNIHKLNEKNVKDWGRCS